MPENPQKTPNNWLDGEPDVEMVVASVIFPPEKVALEKKLALLFLVDAWNPRGVTPAVLPVPARFLKIMFVLTSNHKIFLH